MGSRKQKRAEEIKEAKKAKYFAQLRNCPTSPRKMRLMADLIRGQEVYRALNILKFHPKEASGRLEKLLTSAIANYQQKTGLNAEDSNLFVKEIFVDSAFQLKRIRTAPQGRANKIRKRSNHVTVFIDSKIQQPAAEQVEEVEETQS